MVECKQNVAEACQPDSLCNSATATSASQNRLLSIYTTALCSLGSTLYERIAASLLLVTTQTTIAALCISTCWSNPTLVHACLVRSSHLQHSLKRWPSLQAFSTSSLYASSAVMSSFFAASKIASLTPAHRI